MTFVTLLYPAMYGKREKEGNKPTLHWRATLPEKGASYCTVNTTLYTLNTSLYHTPTWGQDYMEAEFE